ncbi:MAG: single-stranded DNA-binding protein [Puniceicoccales bacterium]|jgi:single-strand selective monofunctional uracil DNA glycosylase|nr:single-stranded DNA-binding protein [Puniceicoccales bacterium]
MNILDATRRLAADLDALTFAPPVAYVYNPLNYAGDVHADYLCRYAAGRKRVIFLGMNPGPFGMAQTGVPFGEINAVQNFLGIFGLVGHPPREHPRKPVEGFGCRRSEVSGRRLWGLFAKKFGTAGAFFAENYVHNYCPLLFIEDTPLGKNLALAQLSAAEIARLGGLCDAFLRALVDEMRPEVLVGVGAFAKGRAEEALAGSGVRVCQIPHPSPANPAANRDWDGAALAALDAAGVEIFH